MSKPNSKSMLWRKLFRDMRDNYKSFIAVFIICLLSVTLYCGIDSAWRGMEKNLDEQFEVCNLSDIWVGGELSDRMLSQIKGIDGVSDAQRRTYIRGTVKNIASEPKLDIYMPEESYKINRPMILGGNELNQSNKNQCIISDAFAKSHGLNIGDTLTVSIGSAQINLYIDGIGYSSEYVVYTDGQSFQTDPNTFGYAYASPGTLSFLPLNQTVIKLNDGTNPSDIKALLADLFDDPLISISLREDKMGIKMAVEEVIQVRALGSVFPVVFFLVAALITWSTMKRLVDIQRLQIGTLRSLGYDKKTLIRHYASYGFLISAIGALLGLVLGLFLIGDIIMGMLRSIYVMPGGVAYLNIYVAMGITLLVIIIATGASYLSCYQALREMPASLLRPKPPKSGRRVFLEHIGFIWKRLSFGSKMIIRNMLRNLTRFFIGMIGIVGCVALLLTGFGMRDSVNYVMDNYYGHSMRFDVRVFLNTQSQTPITDQYLYGLYSRSGADAMEGMLESLCEIKLNDAWLSKGLYVLEDEHNMVYFDGDAGGRKWLPLEGAAITEKMAEDTGLKIGDIIEIRLLNGHSDYIKINDIVSIQLGQGVYMTKSAYRQLDLMPYVPNVLMLQGNNIEIDLLKDMDGVSAVKTALEEKNTNGLVVQVLDLVVVLMVIFAGALALVVLFTLGQLNFYERMRELATLMVLGYYPRENKRLILRENIIIAVLGIPIGLLAGPFLHEWVLASGLPTILEFIPYIAPLSWALTPIFTIAFALIVNILIGRKFKKVDMVEALKSVE